ncbi:hypothetical protein MAR_004560, partial [Mya arenaria]
MMYENIRNIHSFTRVNYTITFTCETISSTFDASLKLPVDPHNGINVQFGEIRRWQDVTMDLFPLPVLLQNGHERLQLF